MISLVRARLLTADLALADPCKSGILRRHTFGRLMCWDRTLPGELVERIWQDPHALLADGSKLQDKLRCTATRLDHSTGPFVWKYHNWDSLRRTLRRSVSRSVARKTWVDSQFLYAAGIPTPRPRAFIERRFGPLKICSYFLSDYVAGASLYRFMRYGNPSTNMLHDLARQVATIWQQLDDLLVCHNDFKTENFIVDPQGKVWLIDLDRLRRYRQVNKMHRKQIRDAGDLLHPRNWRSNPDAAELFRREILRTPAAARAVAGPNGAEHPLTRPLPAENRANQLVTVLIPCLNAADTIAACVGSVRDMADEILVADAGSTDDTLRIVQEIGGCRIIQYNGPDDDRFDSWAHDQARHAWILRLLPRELLNPELARQVQDLLASEPDEDGFRVARTFYFRGKRLKYGGHHLESSIRLCRKEAGQYELRDGQVEVTVSSGDVGQMSARLFYESCGSIKERLSEINRHARRAAEGDNRRGRRPRRRRVFWCAPWRFFLSYVLRGGWLDGWAGLHASALSAIAVYLRETMLWETHQPVASQRVVMSDGREELVAFDRDRAANSLLVALTGPTTMQDGARRVNTTC